VNFRANKHNKKQKEREEKKRNGEKKNKERERKTKLYTTEYVVTCVAYDNGAVMMVSTLLK